MQRPPGKRCMSRCRPKLMALGAGVVLVATVLCAGPVEEWALSPSAGRPLSADAGRLRRAAAALDGGSLRAEAPRLYRLANSGACQEVGEGGGGAGGGGGGGGAVFLLGFVTSKPSHSESRAAIRESWGSVTSVRGRRVKTLFALGLPESEEEQRAVAREAERHRDVVQGLFADTYLNLTLKTIMATRWFVTYCPSAEFLLKVDDDVFLNYRNLVGRLAGLGAGPEDLYLGRVHRNVPVDRDPASLYYTPRWAFLEDTYPNYCSGTSYVLSRQAARKVYVAALSLPLLSIEDVFVGLCAHRVGVQPTHTADMSGGPRFWPGRCCYKSILSSHHLGPQELRAAWGQVDDGRDCSALGRLAGIFVCKLLNLVDQVRAL
uniref:beta-1,3-galactosyltransferase 9-like n=1 Tax=Pristiophorus japonicus TaxID=55135 RepID=UPI00398F692F